MAIRDRNKARRGKKKSAGAPDLYAILASFDEARSFIECGVRLLEDWSGPGLGDEVVCLRHGLDLLTVAYKELDVATLPTKL